MYCTHSTDSSAFSLRFQRKYRERKRGRGWKGRRKLVQNVQSNSIERERIFISSRVNFGKTRNVQSDVTNLICFLAYLLLPIKTSEIPPLPFVHFISTICVLFGFIPLKKRGSIFWEGKNIKWKYFARSPFPTSYFFFSHYLSLSLCLISLFFSLH